MLMQELGKASDKLKPTREEFKKVKKTITKQSTGVTSPNVSLPRACGSCSTEAN